jgi:hypothetical protein
MKKSWQSFNELKNTLSPQDIGQIMLIIGERCHDKTHRRLESILTYGTSAIPLCGILERLHKTESNTWEYCTGQSYPDEIRTIRSIILTGK